MISALVLHLGMQRLSDWHNTSSQVRQAQLRKAIGDLNEPTFFGTVRFNRYNQNIGRDPTLIQYSKEDNKCRGPYGIVSPYETRGKS